MSTRTGDPMIRSAATGVRNGMPGFHDYGYRGHLTLADELPYLCPGGCGRRCKKPGETCAVCRGTWPDTGPSAGQGHRSDLDPSRCARCGYKAGAKNCRLLCGGA